MIQNKKKIILIGGGGHCKSCIDVIESTGLYEIEGILDLPSELGKKVLDYNIIGSDEDIEKFHQKGFCFLITLGQIKTSSFRKKIFNQLESLKAEIETIIASTAKVSKYATIGKGSIIMHHSFLNSDTKIGKNCIINTSSIIEHDAKIGNNSHISTNVVMNGNCEIGSDSFIGSGSCVSSGVHITNQVIVGAGSLVIKNILESGTYIGNPVQIINKK